MRAARMLERTLVAMELFQTIIIRGKGFDVVEEYMSAPFLPTPRAAFRGINLLAKGVRR